MPINWQFVWQHLSDVNSKTCCSDEEWWRFMFTRICRQIGWKLVAALEYKGFILIYIGYYFGLRQVETWTIRTDRQTEESCGHLSQIAGDPSQGCAHRSRWRQLEAKREKKRLKKWGRGNNRKKGRVKCKGWRERDGCIEAGWNHFENDRPDTVSGSQDDRGALAFDRRVATGLRGPI